MSLAAGGPAGQRARQAEDAAPGHAIEVRDARRLQRRLATQRADGLVGHPIAHDDDALHGRSRLAELQHGGQPCEI